MVKRTDASKSHIRKHWSVLCEEIGFRYSGTRGEQLAADYIEQQFKRFGLTSVGQQSFDFPNWDFSMCRLRVGRGRNLKRLGTAIPFCFSVSTPPQGVRGKIVYLEDGGALNFKENLRGKVGLLIGSLSLGEPQLKARLVRSKLAALIVVDARIPYGWITPAGAAPQWVDGYKIPTVSISYLDAVSLIKQLPLDAHLKIKARTFAATSQNVIGEIVGRQRPDQVIIVSGHHDCVWRNVGADDNGSGVIHALELARIFARRRPRRTIRFISYGVEEKLSVGAYIYMRSLSARQRRACVFVLNADTIASHIGNDLIHITGSPQLEKFVSDHWRRQQHPARVHRSVNPYSDHFPLNIIGVPSLWLSRPNMMTEGHWQLHSEHDNLENVSVAVISRTINTSSAFLQGVANAPRLPFSTGIDSKVMKHVRAVAKQTYHHPWSAEQFKYVRV